MAEYQTIIFEEKEGVGFLTLNRPKSLNAISLEMIEEFEVLFRELEESETVRVVILSGAGEKGFCAGLDMKESATRLFGATPAIIYKWQTRFSRIYYMMRRIPQPIIAVIHGAASGGGFSFAMASDIRIISPDARFNAAYINIGLGGADLSSSYFLPKLIGSGRANEFLLTGNFMGAKEAMSLGFASRMVERDALMDTAREIAGTMVEKSPLGLKMTKEAINQNLGVASLEQALHLENRNQAFMITAMKVDSLEGGGE